VNFFTKLKDFFKSPVSENVLKDIDEVKHQFSNGVLQVKRLKTVLKIFVKKANNLIAQV
jgi:hypothetical protein